MNDLLKEEVFSQIKFIGRFQISINDFPILNFNILSLESNDLKIEELKKSLKSLLYNNFYLNPIQLKLKDRDLIGDLRKANKSKKGVVFGMKLEKKNNDGSIIAIKKNQRYFLNAGSYLTQNNKINAYFDKESYSEIDIFYHVFSFPKLIPLPEAIIRFYINTSPEGASYFTQFLSEELKALSVPFQFKVLNNEKYYSRSDSFVLYIHNDFFEKVSFLLTSKSFLFEHLLRKKEPLFTHKIMDGLSWANNPKNPSKSFGTDICEKLSNEFFERYYNF